MPGMGPSIGEEAPGFALRDQHGQVAELADLRATKAVVLMFYPFAFSSVCTGELTEVRDSMDRFRALDAVVLGISCDPMFSLRVFADRDGLDFPLLSDFWPHGEVARRYGVLDDRRGCARRSTFIVDRAGLVRWSVHSPMPEARDLEEQLAVLRSL
jgi:peroxiredoxin